ncbi:hypothetical protein [Geminicoccus roseus]|uniref:hypothetical protein n=1 Tax=Geminicoccus roseus TaxID=404900 RepID=UPI0004802348|nr:hypothetical protein [Geminicoccus roseus]
MFVAVRYRSAYRRYLFYRRLRTVLTCVFGISGIIACYLMYLNLRQNGVPLGRQEMLILAGVMIVSIALPWMVLTKLARKPSEL